LDFEIGISFEIGNLTFEIRAGFRHWPYPLQEMLFSCEHFPNDGEQLVQGQGIARSSASERAKRVRDITKQPPASVAARGAAL
jgi:hypothetical protein